MRDCISDSDRQWQLKQFEAKVNHILLENAPPFVRFKGTLYVAVSQHAQARLLQSINPAPIPQVKMDNELNDLCNCSLDIRRHVQYN